MSRTLIKSNEAEAARRRIFFDLRDATDGITPRTGEAGGQPQISIAGGAWTATGIGTLTHFSNGRYYADLTQSTVANAGDLIESRYTSAGTAESPGNSVQVVGFDPATSLSTFDSSSDTVDVGKVAGATVTDISEFRADISSLSTFDPVTDQVVASNVTSWSSLEMQQIRQRLGLDGDQAAPTATGDLSDIKAIVQAGGR